MVAQESCKLLDRTLARLPAADLSSLQAGTHSGPWEGAAGGDGRGGGASAGVWGAASCQQGPLPQKFWGEGGASLPLPAGGGYNIP